MNQSNDEYPEAQVLDEALQVKVDEKTIIHMEFPSDVKISAVDEATIAVCCEALVEGSTEELKESHDMSPEEILSDANSKIEFSGSDSNEWEDLSDRW